MTTRMSMAVLLVTLLAPVGARADGPIARFRAWRAGRQSPSAKVMNGLKASLDRLAAETRLGAATRARVAAGKKPTWRQRRLTNARMTQLTEVADLAAARFAGGPPKHASPAWIFSEGADWVGALDALEGAYRDLGELTPAREADLATRRRTATAAIFDRVTRDIHELDDAGMHLSLGRGAEDYERLMWGIHGGRPGDDGGGALAFIHEWAAKAAPERARALYSQWARADRALARMAQERRAFAEKEAGVGGEVDWRSLAGPSRASVGRLGPARQKQMYLDGRLDHLRPPSALMGNVPPERLLAQRDDFAGWREKLGMSEQEFGQELAEGLRISFRRAYQRQLGRVRSTIARGNPLLADDGKEALASLRRTIALAAQHGVPIETGGLIRDDALGGRTDQDFAATIGSGRAQIGQPTKAGKIITTGELVEIAHALDELAARKDQID